MPSRSRRHEHGNLANTAGGLFAGLLMGGLLGMGAMLLLAPQSGAKTRAKIEEEGLELRDQVAQTVEDVATQARGKAHHIAAGVHKQAKKLGQSGQEMLDEQKEVVAQAVEAEKAAVHSNSNG